MKVRLKSEPRQPSNPGSGGGGFGGHFGGGQFGAGAHYAPPPAPPANEEAKLYVVGRCRLNR